MMANEYGHKRRMEISVFKVLLGLFRNNIEEIKGKAPGVQITLNYGGGFGRCRSLEKERLLHGEHVKMFCQ